MELVVDAWTASHWRISRLIRSAARRLLVSRSTELVRKATVRMKFVARFTPATTTIVARITKNRISIRLNPARRFSLIDIFEKSVFGDQGAHGTGAFHLAG